jgi:hypothetical protein
MNAFHYFIDRWGALASAIVLLAVPAIGWHYRGYWGWIETVVGGVGVAALLLAVEDFLRRLERRRGGACPHCGEPLLEGA